MNDFPEYECNSGRVADMISHVNFCNDMIEYLSEAKQHSEAELAKLLEHTKCGAHTHTFRDWKITITTGLNYKLNIDKFIETLSAPEKIDDRFPIVKQVTKFELNNKAIRDCELYGTQQDNLIKDLYLTSSPKKLHVKIFKDDEKKDKIK
jgi:hypothetical protein